MKILKPGRIKQVVFVGTCQHCGCRVECQECEVRVITDRPGDTAYAVTCPTCKDQFLWLQKKGKK